MDQAQQQFLMLERLPARLTVQQAAWLLGFPAHQIPLLISARLLKPLGHPAPNAPKYFASAIIQQLQSDSKWLEKASDETLRYWKRKNARRRSGTAELGTPFAENTRPHNVNGSSRIPHATPAQTRTL